MPFVILLDKFNIYLDEIDDFVEVEYPIKSPLRTQKKTLRTIDRGSYYCMCTHKNCVEFFSFLEMLLPY